MLYFCSNSNGFKANFKSKVAQIVGLAKLIKVVWISEPLFVDTEKPNTWSFKEMRLKIVKSWKILYSLAQEMNSRKFHFNCCAKYCFWIQTEWIVCNLFLFLISTQFHSIRIQLKKPIPRAANSWNETLKLMAWNVRKKKAIIRLTWKLVKVDSLIWCSI